jgi:hypothetical protein
MYFRLSQRVSIRPILCGVSNHKSKWGLTKEQMTTRDKWQTCARNTLYPEEIEKGKAIPVQAYDRPRGFQEFEAPRFRDNRHMSVVRLSALHTGHLYLRKKYSWYLLLLEADLKPGTVVRPEGLCQWKIRMIPSEFEFATFRLVAQCFKQLCRQITNFLPYSMFENSPQET